eukprot:scaffold8087_cov420-Pinguiococcus_pyrenoidosus.AAC.1
MRFSLKSCSPICCASVGPKFTISTRVRQCGAAARFRTAGNSVSMRFSRPIPHFGVRVLQQRQRTRDKSLHGGLPPDGRRQTCDVHGSTTAHIIRLVTRQRLTAREDVLDQQLSGPQLALLREVLAGTKSNLRLGVCQEPPKGGTESGMRQVRVEHPAELDHPVGKAPANPPGLVGGKPQREIHQRPALQCRRQRPRQMHDWLHQLAPHGVLLVPTEPLQDGHQSAADLACLQVSAEISEVRAQLLPHGRDGVVGQVRRPCVEVLPAGDVQAREDDRDE